MLDQVIKKLVSFFNNAKKRFPEPALSAIRNEQEHLVIKDVSPLTIISELKLESLEAKIYEIRDSGATYAELARAFCRAYSKFDEWLLRETLSCLIDNNILINTVGFI